MSSYLMAETFPGSLKTWKCNFSTSPRAEQLCIHKLFFCIKINPTVNEIKGNVIEILFKILQSLLKYRYILKCHDTKNMFDSRP